MKLEVIHRTPPPPRPPLALTSPSSSRPGSSRSEEQINSLNSPERSPASCNHLIRRK